MEKNHSHRIFLWILGAILVIGIPIVGYLNASIQKNSRTIEGINTSLARVETDLHWVKVGIEKLDKKMDLITCPEKK